MTLINLDEGTRLAGIEKVLESDEENGNGNGNGNDEGKHGPEGE